MIDDATLLRRYTEDESEAAFTELVRRHFDLVYAAALRRTAGDSHRAAEIAQDVFTKLARNAGKLRSHPVLGAWLHAATRNAAINLMVSEQRRRSRETVAMKLEDGGPSAGADADWNQVRPLLDAAIDELSEPDRRAIVLRYLELRPYAEVSSVLQVSEDAARMRTARALDRLRNILCRRGIVSTAAALEAMVVGHASVSAPAGLSASLASAAIAGRAGGAITQFLSHMSHPIIATAVLGTVGFVGVGTYVVRFHKADERARPPVVPVTALATTSKQPGRDDTRSATEGQPPAHTTSSATSAQVPTAPAESASPPGRTPAEQLDAMSHNLRQIAASIHQFYLENRRPPSSLNELVGEGKIIKRLIAINGESYDGLPLQPGQSLTVINADGVVATYHPPPSVTLPSAEDFERSGRAQEVARLVAQRREAGRRTTELLGAERAQNISANAKRARDAYRAANEGRMPRTSEALIPYFANTQDAADYVEELAIRKQVESEQKAREIR